MGLTVAQFTDEKHTAKLYAELNARLSDSKVADQASVWQPIAMQVKNICDSTINYIEALKLELKSSSNLSINDGREIYDLDNKTGVETIFT